jgi:hypothetical protein
MKFIAPASISFLLGVASAFPTHLQVRAEPSNAPINVRNPQTQTCHYGESADNVNTVEPGPRFRH